MTPLSDDELSAAANLRVRRALESIERAQNELASACGELSALEGANPVWKACAVLTDRVHKFWYRVSDFRAAGKFKLDRTHIEALQRTRQQAHPQRGPVPFDTVPLDAPSPFDFGNAPERDE